MISYTDCKQALFTRGITFNTNQYLYILQVVLGEDKSVAYGMVYDKDNFARNIEGEDGDEYLIGINRDAEIMFQQQECKHLYDILNEDYQRDIQEKATNLKNYKFTGAEVQQLLANLLANRIGNGENLDDASVKDVIQIIKSLSEQGALESGDSFQKHFITVHEKFNALCPKCGHEMDAFAGVNVVCPHCKQVYEWNETERRFYPQIETL